MKLPLLYSEPYLTSFTPRNKKPSHSSSGKTSSKFELLEIKIKEKTNWVGKAEQSSVYYFLEKLYKGVRLWEKTPEGSLKENYNRLYRKAFHHSFLLSN